MRLKLVRLPDALHRAQRDAGPWPSLDRSNASPRAAGRHRSVPPPAPRFRPGSAALPGLRVLSRSSPSTPGLGKALLPAPDHRSADADRRRRSAAPGGAPGRRQNDPRPSPRASAAGCRSASNRRQPPSIRSAHNHAYCLCHAARIRMARRTCESPECVSALVALHTGFDRLPWAGEKLRQTAGVNQQFYAAGDARLSSDEALAFERDQHLVD